MSFIKYIKSKQKKEVIKNILLLAELLCLQHTDFPLLLLSFSYQEDDYLVLRTHDGAVPTC